jgi:MYXO-CTERM domain-containing protein
MSQHLCSTPARRLRALLAAACLAGASLAAQAALLGIAGEVDSGPLAGQAFSGRLSYADPAGGFTGAVDLDQFELFFDGQFYALANASGPALAWFDNGAFLGVDVSFADARPAVQLLAGFTDVSEAYFAYDRSGQGIEGFGSVSFRVEHTVAEPGAAALALAGLALLGGARLRRRPQALPASACKA